MEHVVEELIRDFENGRITRRQLIKSLTVAVASAVPGASLAAQEKTMTIPAPTGPAPWKTVWLDHISYAVSDYRRSTAFYRDLMGWEPLTDDGKNQCSMKIGTIGGIIVRNNRQMGSGGAPPAGREGQPPITGVINHISWGIEPWDTDKVKAELERRGLSPRPDMVGDKFKSFHVKDPDGWDLQISNQKDTSQL